MEFLQEKKCGISARKEMWNFCERRNVEFLREKSGIFVSEEMWNFCERRNVEFLREKKWNF